MDEIKPVAWVDAEDIEQLLADGDACRDIYARQIDGAFVPLYDQQAIDTLRAEVERLNGANEVIATSHRWMSGERDREKARAERAEAEAEALRKDAERYRWLRLALLGAENDPIDHLLLEKEPETDAEFDAAVDAAIDAAKQAQP